MSPAPRAEIVIDLAAIRHNVRRLRELTGVPVMTVVKADGYGHGMVDCARAAREGGAAWLGVATVAEALALREGGDTGPLLCWLDVPGDDYAAAIEADVELTAYSLDELTDVILAGEQAGRPAKCQIKVDTGLSRGGASRSAWEPLLEAAAVAERSGLLTITGVWSHLACSDEPDHPANAAQAAAFAEALDLTERVGLRPRVCHLANSAGALLHPDLRFDLVRCGIASYGISPAPDVVSSADLGLVPAMTVRTRLALVKDVPAGSGVSYGHTFTTAADATLGVVPVGYAEGVLRSGSSALPVLVRGERQAGVRRALGRICMDQFVVDVSGLGARPGDEVVLFGPGDDGEPTAQDWGEACGTIAYEVVTRMGGRMTRRHVDSERGDS